MEAAAESGSEGFQCSGEGAEVMEAGRGFQSGAVRGKKGMMERWVVGALVVQSLSASRSL